MSDSSDRQTGRKCDASTGAGIGRRRNRPFLGGTVDPETRRKALAWILSSPAGARRSVGQWIDRLVERASGHDRSRQASDALVRQRARLHLGAICAAAARLACCRDPAERAQRLTEIRQATGEIDRLLAQAASAPAPPEVKT